MEKFKFFVVLAMILLLNPMSEAAIPKPLLEYLFNEDGVYAESTGTINEPLLLYKGTNNIDIRTDGGFGISGSLGDRALDCANSDNGIWGWASHDGDLDEIDGLKSFTLQGWYKLPESAYLNAGGRFFDNERDFRLTGWSTRLSFTVGGTNIRSESFHEYSNTEWTFFAVTFDGELTEDNVHFYVGSKTEPVRLINTATLNDIAPNSSWRLRIGGLSGTDSPIKAYLDNMRVFGSKEDSCGVLSINQLEAIRIADGLLIPDLEISRIDVSTTSCQADSDEQITIKIYVFDQFSTPIKGQRIILNKIAGDLMFEQMDANTDKDGIAIFIISSREAGIVILEASVDLGYGLTPLTFPEKLTLQFYEYLESQN